MNPPAHQRSAPAIAGLTLAVLLIAAGVLVSSALWLRLFGVSAPEPELVQGVALFRIALVTVGVYGLIGLRLQFWRGPVSEANAVGGPQDRTPGVLWLVLAAGAALRLYHLEGGLWIDEVTTLVRYAREPFGTIVTTYDSQNQHLLYSLLAQACFRVFGESIWALRLPAALFGIGGLAALYLLAREVTDRREALLGTTLLAFSYQHIWYSQSARGYSGLLFWSLLSTWLLLRAMRTGRGGLWLAYAVSVALGAYTHQTMVFVAFGHFATYLHSLWRNRASRSGGWWLPIASGFVPSALLSILLYALVLPQFPSTTATDVSVVRTWLSPLWTLREVAQGFHLGPLLGVALVLGGGTLLLGLRGYLRTAPGIAITFAVSTAAGTAAMLALAHPIWPRFFFFAAGFGVLVLVRGLSEVAALLARRMRWTSARAAMVATGLTLAVGIADARALRYVYLPKQDFAGARDFVNASRVPGDEVVTVGVVSGSFLNHFEPSWRRADSASGLNAIRAASRRTWLLYTMPIEMESEHADVMDLVRREFVLVREFGGTLNGGTIYVYRADRSAASTPPTNPQGGGN